MTTADPMPRGGRRAPIAAVRTAVRQWARTRAIKGRGRTQRRGVTAALLLALLVLLAGFGWSLSFLYGGTDPGQTVGLGVVTSLAEQGRLSQVTLRDFDNVVVAHYGPLPVRLPTPATKHKTKRTKSARNGPTPTVSATATVAPTPTPATTPAATAGSLRPPSQGILHAAVPGGGSAFQALGNVLRDTNTPYVVDQQGNKHAVQAISTFLLPLMVLADLFALLFTVTRAGGSAIGEVMVFGTIGRGRLKRGASTIGFEDVGGADEAVAELREVRDYLADPERYQALGAAPPKGVLLFGAPGTGKTLLAKAVAGEAGVPFFNVAGAEFVESLVGVGAARVRDLFARVRAAAPAIVFIDELDAAGRKRGSGAGSGGSDEREQTLNQLLVEMDGFEIAQGIVVVGATNRPDILDPALLRPGRFDRHITIDRPDLEGRAHILRIHAKGKPLASDVSLDEVARRTPGFTGADLANVMNESVLLAIRDGRNEVTASDVSEAVQRVLSGPKRRGRLLSDEERRRLAVHEAGHATYVAAHGDPTSLHRISILSRGAVGGTTQVAADDAAVLSRDNLTTRLAGLVSGLAAERLVLGSGSTAGEPDIARASVLARDMVARYGLSERVGPVRLLAASGAGFLDEDTPLADVSPQQQDALDAEVRRLVDTAVDDATGVLRRHRAGFDALVQQLLDQETLDGETLAEALARITTPATTSRSVTRKRSTARRSNTT
ncbi:MAG TPA: ATP-dependent zinc metalloprotease FtsH [Mycobacteriales bacterium]|nr:ATP-dependent zinc metalloprotease FtsH [Mycobacteriales bacterium]